MRCTVKNSLFYIMIFILIIVLCLGNFSTAFAEIDPDPIVESEKLTVLKGTPFEAVFDFTHGAYSKGDDIKISVKSPNGAISLGKKTFETKEDEIDRSPDDSSADYRLIIPEKYMKRTGDGAGTLRFTITYYDGSSKKESYTVQKTIFDPNSTDSNPEDEGRLSVLSYKLDHSPIKEGDKFNITITIKNFGNRVCNNVLAVLDTSTAEGISLNGITDTKYIDYIEADETSTFSYSMTCLSKMETNNYPISLIISANELSKSVTSKIYIPINGTKAGKDDTGSPDESKPQIIIENYDYGGKPVMGGKEFNLSMRFRNTNMLTNIENLKITVSSVAGSDDKSVGGAFTPAKSSNTFYISKVKPNSSFSEQIALLPKSDATPNSYGVSIAFNYEAVINGKREAIETTETISIPLTQSDRFEVNNVDIPEQFPLGEPCPLNINYVNKGKSKIFNLSVKLEGNFTSAESDLYIGNVDSGIGDSFQTDLQPKADGPLSGKATFTYEDSTGETKTITKDFSSEVIPMDNIPVDNMNPEEMPVEQKQGISPWIIWVSILAGVIIGIVILVKTLKKRKLKKLRMLEENDDYDDVPTAQLESNEINNSVDDNSDNSEKSDAEETINSTSNEKENSNEV